MRFFLVSTRHNVGINFPEKSCNHSRRNASKFGESKGFEKQDDIGYENIKMNEFLCRPMSHFYVEYIQMPYRQTISAATVPSNINGVERYTEVILYYCCCIAD